MWKSIRRSAERHVPRGARWQPLWRALHAISLSGMNYGRGAVEDDADTVPARMIRAAHPIIFDGGAHVGAYSTNVLRVLPGALVFAFEPAPAAFEELRRNLDGVAEVFELGLSDESGEVKLYSAEAASTSASILPQDRTHWDEPAEFSARHTIRVTTIDDFCAEHGIEHIDLLKLDIEGAELAALRGAERMRAEGRIGLIQFEWGLPALSGRVQLRDFYELLEGWEIHRIVAGGTVALRWHERWEIAWTTNYLAIAPAVAGARTTLSPPDRDQQLARAGGRRRQVA